MPKPRVVATKVGGFERPAGRSRGATWSVYACDLFQPPRARRPVSHFARLELRHHGPDDGTRPYVIRTDEIRAVIGLLSAAAEQIGARPLHVEPDDVLWDGAFAGIAPAFPPL